MSVGKILLYYCFTPLSDPTAIKLWQRDLCESLGLTGRILVSKHGINGTVGGDIDACKRYVKKTREYPAFKKMEFKWSEGSADDFPRLSVKDREEIVAFGAPDESWRLTKTAWSAAAPTSNRNRSTSWSPSVAMTSSSSTGATPWRRRLASSKTPWCPT